VTQDSSAPGKTTITGYGFLQADSIQEAVALMKGHPHFFMPGASAQILECIGCEKVSADRVEGDVNRG